MPSRLRMGASVAARTRCLRDLHQANSQSCRLSSTAPFELVFHGMSDSGIRIEIRGEADGRRHTLDLTTEPGQPVELGRVDASRGSAEQLFVPLVTTVGMRLPVAAASQTDVSRRQLLIEPLPGDAVRLRNLSSSIPVLCFERPSLSPGETVDCPLPVSLRMSAVVVSLGKASADAAAGVVMSTLERPAALSSGGTAFGRRALAEFTREMPLSAVEGLVRWWREVIDVLQSATNSGDFFLKSAQAIVRLVGLDLGAVFLHDQGGWKPAVIETAGASSARPSTGVLAKLLAEKRTFFSRVEGEVDARTSLAALESFVVAPILDRDERVIGALYGHRSRSLSRAGSEAITRLEALLVETLACGVAAGLARLEQERTALARKVQFEQFFSSELSAELEVQPDLLAGRDTEVSVLFCDIRGFSRVSERLAPAQTMEWIGGVLSALSDEVVAAKGVLVDYVGDELLAMWGAPQPQPDHAVRACRAARAMLRQAGPINARWEGIVGAPTGFGIGINSAVTRVGNIGSTRKFKYGPLGNGVNLGSRVQGATKYLRVPMLVTGATRRLVGTEFLARRLCSVRVVNIAEPVELHELDGTDEPGRREIFSQYEEALVAFETGNFAAAARELGNLLGIAPGDGPSLVLLSRAVDCMIREPTGFSPVWELPGK